MPIVNSRFGEDLSISSKIAFTIPGVNSFDDSPYLPPITRGRAVNLLPTSVSLREASISKNKGSPKEPGSFVLSKTAIFLVLRGRASIIAFTGKGRYNLTAKTPIFAE